MQAIDEGRDEIVKNKLTEFVRESLEAAMAAIIHLEMKNDDETVKQINVFCELLKLKLTTLDSRLTMLIMTQSEISLDDDEIIGEIQS